MSETRTDGPKHIAGKPPPVGSESEDWWFGAGWGALESNSRVVHCATCQKELPHGEGKKCRLCKEERSSDAAYYCGSVCAKAHWKEHKLVHRASKESTKTDEEVKPESSTVPPPATTTAPPPPPTTGRGGRGRGGRGRGKAVAHSEAK